MGRSLTWKRARYFTRGWTRTRKRRILMMDEDGKALKRVIAESLRQGAYGDTLLREVA